MLMYIGPAPGRNAARSRHSARPGRRRHPRTDRPRHESPTEVSAREVTTMPRSLTDVLAHADDIADEFESYEPRDADRRPAEPLLAARLAVAQPAPAGRDADHRHQGDARRGVHDWAAIGAAVGTSWQAARQRYGPLIEPSAPAPGSPRRRRPRAAVTTTKGAAPNATVKKQLRESTTVHRFTKLPGGEARSGDPTAASPPGVRPRTSSGAPDHAGTTPVRDPDPARQPRQGQSRPGEHDRTLTPVRRRRDRLSGTARPPQVEPLPE